MLALPCTRPQHPTALCVLVGLDRSTSPMHVVVPTLPRLARLPALVTPNANGTPCPLVAPRVRPMYIYGRAVASLR